VAGEEACEDGLEVVVRVVVGKIGKVCVEGGGLLGEGVQDQVVGGALGAGVGGVEAQGEGAVEDVGEGDEGVGWGGEVDEQEGCDGLGGVSFFSLLSKDS
jgi:hypothetical protein